MPKTTKRIARYGQGRGEIVTKRNLPLSTFLKRLGIGRSTLIMLRNRGLPTHYIGRRVFIDGQEVVDFFRIIFAQNASGDITKSDNQGEIDDPSRTHRTARKPATKFAHLRKKMERNRIVTKFGKKK